MSDRPNKEQMMKIVVPALAISVILVLVGLLIGLQGDKDDPKKPGTKPGNGPPPVPLKATGDDSGMSDTAPPADAAEWKEIGGGLKIWDVKEGEGEPCPPGANVSMHYAGWLLSGRLFDSSRPKLKHGPGAPLNASLAGGLIEGWMKGVPGMKKNGIRRLYIPYQMAYQEQGQPPDIPPRADLIFEVKLIDNN